jgi:hypothetical protein
VAEFRRAVGDDEALPVLRDYAASDLLRRTSRPDGTLDPRKVDIWRRQHAEALKAFPELDRQAADAAVASTMIAEAQAGRKAALDNYQIGLIGKLVDASDREDAVARIGAIFGRADSVALTRRLLAETRGDADAQEGVRKAVVDYMANRFIGNTEAATTGLGTLRSDRFQEFLKQNRGPLSLIFKGNEVRALEAIAADLQRANRSIVSVKLPGGSNTTQDLLGASQGEQSLFSRIAGLAIRAAGGAAGFGVAGPWGTLAALIGTHTVLTMRQAGLDSVGDLVKAAMLDPGIARALLSKRPLKDSSIMARALAKRFRTMATVLATDASAPQEEAPPPLTVHLTAEERKRYLNGATR